jgi:hypothetical protein
LVIIDDKKQPEQKWTVAKDWAVVPGASNVTHITEVIHILSLGLANLYTRKELNDNHPYDAYYVLQLVEAKFREQKDKTGEQLARALWEARNEVAHSNPNCAKNVNVFNCFSKSITLLNLMGRHAFSQRIERGKRCWLRGMNEKNTAILVKEGMVAEPEVWLRCVRDAKVGTFAVLEYLYGAYPNVESRGIELLQVNTRPNYGQTTGILWAPATTNRKQACIRGTWAKQASDHAHAFAMVSVVIFFESTETETLTLPTPVVNKLEEFAHCLFREQE